MYANDTNPKDTVRVKGSYANTVVLKKHRSDLDSVSLTGHGTFAVTNALSSSA